MFGFIKNLFASAAPVTQEQTMAAAARIEALLTKAGTIAVFSKSYCPYCRSAKSILQSYGGVKPRLQILELDELGREGVAIQDALAEKLGKSRVTVPQIFISGKHIGGCDDLKAAQANGSLDEMMEEVLKTKTASA